MYGTKTNKLLVGLLLFVSAVFCISTSQAAQKFTRSQAYGDWTLNCSKDNNPKTKSKEKCSLQQNIVHKKGSRLLTIKIIKIKKRAEKMAVFAIPLGFYIPDGAKIIIDKGKSRRLLVTHCIPSGCMAQISLSRKLFNELSKGKKMYVGVVTGNRAKKLSFPISLKGISSGLSAIK
jgi:invasion protein IalB